MLAAKNSPKDSRRVRWTARTMVLVCVVILSVGRLGFAEGARAAAPVIKDFSSTGGNPENKTGPKDTMYLVKPGDKITFSVNVEGAEKYEWQVNKKVDAEATGETFTWTVPNDKGIWEIHLTAFGEVVRPGGKEGRHSFPPALAQAHQEWVVSTLSKSEAPDFFDYFTDGNFTGERDEKDPWGRVLKAWQPNPKLAATDGFIKATADDSSGNLLRTKTDLSISTGTWKFWYRFPDGNTGHFGCSVSTEGKTPRGNWMYGKCSDTHHHCTVGGRPECAYSFDYDGTGWAEDGKWHQVTVIRTKDKWLYMFNDYIFEFYVNDRLTEPPSIIKLGLARYNGHEAYIDNVEVYADKYLFPQVSVHYGKYAWNYRRNMKDGRYYPQTREGIIVRGRGAGLADIARLLDDPSKFSYDEKTRKAVCSADLVIHDGAGLSMKDQTLLFNCQTDGERHFVLKYGADVEIEDSTITTADDHYFVWNNASSTTHFGRCTTSAKVDPIEFNPVGASGSVWPLGNAGVIRFKASGSTINNAAHIFWDSPMELDIVDTKFTNLRELDIGDYEGTGHWSARERLFARGDKSFYVYTDDINTDKFNLRNVSFNGRKRPIDVTFLINALRDKLNVYDLKLEDENIVIKKSMPQMCGQSHTWQGYLDVSYSTYAGKVFPNPMGEPGTGMDSRLGLVNCKFKDIVVPTDKAWAVPKYYLDVKVVDKAGQPVSGATVSVTNEVDNANYPAENADEKQPMFDPKPSSANQYFYLSYQLIQGLPLPSTVTGTDGHTPLPTDGKNTVIVADFVQDKDGKKEFTYTISVEANGIKKVITGVNPGPGWYRPAPNKPTYTITAVLDGKTVTEAELKKKGSK